MATTRNNRYTPTPWLRPGQRFSQGDGASSDGELTIARLVEDPMGLTHAILRDQSGREVSTYADQIRFAVEAGMLSPMDVTPTSLSC